MYLLAFGIIAVLFTVVIVYLRFVFTNIIYKIELFLDIFLTFFNLALCQDISI